MSEVYKRCQCLFLVFAVIVVLGMLSIVVAVPIDDKTVLYMSFDQEPEGEVVDDESGYGNHGSIIGQGVEWTRDGKFNGALEFDGTSKIDIPHSDSLNLDVGITLEIWFKTDLPQKGRFLIYKIHIGGGRNYEWGIYLTTDSTNASMYVVKPNDEVKAVTIGGEYKDEEWHFLAGTFDGETMKCYVDGQVESEKWPADIRASEGQVVIGTWGANFFAGVLDEARICNVALTEEQLKSDYENGYTFVAVDSASKLAATWAEIKTR